MRVEWHGQSAFSLSTGETAVSIDPFGDLSSFAGRGIQWDYPPITGVSADLVLVTHEHIDHNGVEAIGGDPAVLRSTAGTLESPVGQVTAIASEHDRRAGTERGPNTIFAFELGGLRVCHLGDLGQSSLREEQAAAIGDVDLLFVPVGGGPTIGAEQAAEIVVRLAPSWAVPMHYRSERVGFLEPADAFIALFRDVTHLSEPWFQTDEHPAQDAPLILVPAAP